MYFFFIVIKILKDMVLFFQSSIFQIISNDRLINLDNPKELNYSCQKKIAEMIKWRVKKKIGYHTREVSSTKSDRTKATVKADKRDTMMTIFSNFLSSTNRECCHSGYLFIKLFIYWRINGEKTRQQKYIVEELRVFCFPNSLSFDRDIF